MKRVEYIHFLIIFTYFSRRPFLSHTYCDSIIIILLAYAESVPCKYQRARERESERSRMRVNTNFDFILV